MSRQHAKHPAVLIVLCAVVIIGAKELIHFSLSIVGLFAHDEPIWRLLISIPVIAAVFVAHYHMYKRLLR